MANQYYEPARNRFSLDLHGVLKRDAARVIRKRIEECSRFGIATLEIIYGTPDIFDGSIASVLHGVVRESPLVDASRLPREFVEDCAQYACRIAKIDLALRSTFAALPRSEWMFAPFPASREPDIWLRRRCEIAFNPFQTTFSKEDAARITGRGCRADDLPSDALSLADLETFCREWVPPVLETAAALPEPIPASAPPAEEHLDPATRAERGWTAIWSEAADQMEKKNWRACEAGLQRCLDLSAQTKDPRFLARTLGALAIVSAAKRNREQSKAYYASASAAYDDHSGPPDGELFEVTSRLVEGMVNEGRLAEAAVLLGGERERLEQDPQAPSDLLAYAFNFEASLYARLGQPERAGDLFARALARIESDPAVSHAVTANLRFQLGLIAAARGDARPALAYLTQAAEEFDLAPETSPFQRFLCLREVAAVADQLGYGDRSQKILSDLVATPAEPGSLFDLARVEALIDLGNLYFRQHFWAEAERRYRQAAESRALPADLLFTIHENLGCIYTHTGRLQEAEAQLLHAFAISRETPPQTEFRVAHLRRNMAVLFERTGRFADARAAYDEVLRTFTGAMSKHPEAAEAHFGLGLLFAQDRDFEEAEYHLRLALGLKEHVYGEGRPATAINLIKLGHVLAERGAMTQARPMLAHGIRILEEHRIDAALLWEAYSRLASVQAAMGQHREAKKSMDKAQFYGRAVHDSNRAVSARVN